MWTILYLINIDVNALEIFQRRRTNSSCTNTILKNDRIDNNIDKGWCEEITDT